jgi:hypothetical protein
MKLFSQQFRECSEQGLTKGKMRKKLTPDMLPFCPTKREAFLKQKITHLNFVRCGRFGGQCRGHHPKCQALRKETP